MHRIVPELLTESLISNEIWVRIKGNSMEPFLKDGAEVLVKKSQRFFYGDVLVYKHNGDIISHRFIRKLKDEHGNILYQAKGDNDSFMDDPVVSGDILGKITAIKKGECVIRIDNFPGCIRAVYLWLLSLTEVVRRKYVK